MKIFDKKFGRKLSQRLTTNYNACVKTLLEILNPSLPPTHRVAPTAVAL